MTGLEEIFTRIDSKLNSHINKLQEISRMPSISVEGRGTKECSEFIARWMDELKFDDVSVYSGSENPIIYGKLHGTEEYDRVLLLYGAYDSNPVDEDKWSIPPFEGRIVEHKEKGRILVGRGVNNKMKVVGILHAIEAIKSNDIPLDIIVIFDGEEEMFSPTLPNFIKEYKTKLEIADALYMPFGSQNSQGVSRVQLGYKGVLYLELTASGNEWGRGPSTHEIHSMHRPAVDNPIWHLMAALKSFISDDYNEVIIDGFMDDVDKPDNNFLELVDILSEKFDIEGYKKSHSVRNLVGNEKDPKKLLERLMFTCQINIDGIWGGYTGAGPEAVIPEMAKAKLDIRLIPNQTTQKMYDRISNHLVKNGFSDINLEMLACVESCRTGVKEVVAQSLISAYESLNKPYQIWPTSLATIPIYLFNQEPLNLPFATGCVGSGGHSHGFDEFFLIDGNNNVDGVAGYEKLIASMIWNYAHQSP